MKAIFLFGFALFLLASCGGGSDNSKTEAPKTNDITKNPDYQKGLALVSKSNCFTCHEIDTKKTGPAYRDVADKYASYPDTIVTHLAKKVISGGMGVWGEIPMLPHPELSQADAEAMVKYVLLLKTQK